MPIIWIERIPLWCILATLLKNTAQYLKTFVLSKVLSFVQLIPPMVWFTMDLQTGHLEDRYHARIILLLLFFMKFFCIFFPNQFFQKTVFFCVLASENQEAFSERCSPISSVLQGLVRICKRCMEVNHFFSPKLQSWKITFGRMIL